MITFGGYRNCLMIIKGKHIWKIALILLAFKSFHLILFSYTPLKWSLIIKIPDSCWDPTVVTYHYLQPVLCLIQWRPRNSHFLSIKLGKKGLSITWFCLTWCSHLRVQNSFRTANQTGLKCVCVYGGGTLSFQHNQCSIK